MPPDPAHRHYLPAAFDARAIRILLVGCGGNGAQMLMGLAALDTALRAISSRSLHVTTVDDDIVSEANLARQPFYACDLGHSKVRTSVARGRTGLKDDGAPPFSLALGRQRAPAGVSRRQGKS